jgi:hypothetical protein
MGFRFVAHASDTITAGFALENPEQYVGGAVVLPSAFPAGEVNTGSSALAASSPVPNAYPDIIGKITFDPKIGSTHQHVDAAFLIRGYKTFNPGTSATATETGTGGSVNVVLEPMKDVRLIATNFFRAGRPIHRQRETFPTSSSTRIRRCRW